MNLLPRRLITFLLTALCLAACNSVRPHEDAAWSIILPKSGTSQEAEAANLLAKIMHQATGIRLPITTEGQGSEGGRIFIGNTQAGLAYAAQLGVDPLALGEDGFTIRAVGGDLIFIAGSADGCPTEALGIVYAVNHYLETQFGVRFWAPGVLHVPKADAFRVPNGLRITQSPPIWFRQVNYGPANDPDYRRWHKLDRVQEEVGRLWAPRWVHSAFHHLSPKEYYTEHPEYFSLVGSARTPSQLCLSNPEVLEIVAKSFERSLAENLGVRYISFSQEDNYDACACTSCAAIDAREESQMGSLLTFVNALAERFPKQIISTLAYQYSRKPPKNLQPRKNVSIMLCTIEEDRARPITENPSSTFPAHLEGWSQISDDIFLWDYEVQFASPVAPFPNLRTLSPNVRWFAENGVRHVFLQGNGLRTEFAELRCYLLAKLAWDPNVDVDALIDEFLAGYYGSAATHLRAYIDLLHDELQASGEELVLYGNPALAKDSWLRPQVLHQAKLHFDAAEAQVSGDVELATRVRTARLPLMYAELEIAKRRGAGSGGIWEMRSVQNSNSTTQTKLQPRQEIRNLLNAFITGCEAVGIAKLREYDLSMEVYRQEWDRLLDPNLPNHLAYGSKIDATPSANPQYADGDVRRLVDGLPGGRPGSAPVTRAYGENWVGWMGTGASITLTPNNSITSATRLSFHALQEPKSWIWLPRSIRVEGRGADGTWQELAILKHEIDDQANLAHHFEVELPTSHQFTTLRLDVEATITCPNWHLGAGSPSWFFLDELRID
ncbi:MAG: DUF4838 domain-containing protein [Planctomycetes bacterium]|nr:DUF4838 domain-containing protein [Planctomycetota bacterium]